MVKRVTEQRSSRYIQLRCMRPQPIYFCWDWVGRDLADWHPCITHAISILSRRAEAINESTASQHCCDLLSVFTNNFGSADTANTCYWWRISYIFKQRSCVARGLESGRTFALAGKYLVSWLYLDFSVYLDGIIKAIANQLCFAMILIQYFVQYEPM